MKYYMAPVADHMLVKVAVISAAIYHVLNSVMLQECDKCKIDSRLMVTMLQLHRE